MHDIASEIEGKTVTEVKSYAATFWERGPTQLADWDKHVGKIEDGERRWEKMQEMHQAIAMKCKQVSQQTSVSSAANVVADLRVRVQLIRHLKTCTTDVYIHTQ